ncbi:hypothetical protein FHS85_003161 [Rhodoligotrophos appendicifer]|uniref:hypothetical protein n=1 Tax=Rhodoligotrophos appendicifer TaxID=987056 RepID=UPI001186AA30|nr:hypothetical protein [Rhodoligotrophos appendicifer]
MLNRSSAVLLGGLALLSTAKPALSDQLEELRAELSSLETRIMTLQMASPTPAPPRRASRISIISGSAALADWPTDNPSDAVPPSAGLTVAIAPSADLPVPVHQLTIAGYVKGAVIYDFNQNLGDQFNYNEIVDIEDQHHVQLQATRSRFDIKSRSQTSIGEIRTVVQTDFFTSDADLRLRYAWGEWELAPGWTLGAGQFDRNYRSNFNGTPKVDPKPSAGLVETQRNAQVRASWRSGASEFAISIEDPTGDTGDLAAASGSAGGGSYQTGAQTTAAGASDTIPDLAARWTYADGEGSEFLLSAMLRNFRTDGDASGRARNDCALGWGLKASGTLKLSRLLSLYGSAQYGSGLGNYLVGTSFGAYVDPASGKIETVDQLGLFAGISVALSDSLSTNLGWGYATQKRNDVVDSGITDATVEVMALHANAMWRPASLLRFGWEVIWGERERTISVAPDVLGTETNNNVRAHFGAWFYF